MPADDNPYAAPLTTVKIPRPSPEVTYLSLFLTWEKLRLVYNSVLLIETMTLLMMFPPRRTNFWTLYTLALGCFTANVCFCIGPVLNGYAHWMGLRHPSVATAIFLIGLLLAIGLAGIVVISLHLPPRF